MVFWVWISDSVFGSGVMFTLKDERHVFLFSICSEGTGIEGMDGVSLVVEAASDIGPQERGDMFLEECFCTSSVLQFPLVA